MLHLKVILFFRLKKRISQTLFQSAFSPMVLSFQVLVLTSNVITYGKSKLKLVYIKMTNFIIYIYVIILFTYLNLSTFRYKLFL